MNAFAVGAKISPQALALAKNEFEQSSLSSSATGSGSGTMRGHSRSANGNPGSTLAFIAPAAVVEGSITLEQDADGANPVHMLTSSTSK
jgi:hypothetical protein